MFNNQNKETTNDSKKGFVSPDPKKDASKVTEPKKDEIKLDPKRAEADKK